MNKSYFDIILPLMENKKVLDIGSISHNFTERDLYKKWNFDVFLEHTKYLMGIDILEEDVKKAAAEGYNITCADAENFIANDKFDLVFGGDVIEHLSNPGLFLNCCYKNLSNDGLLILATPNTFSFAKILRALIRLTNEPPVNVEHTCYFTPQTLTELASREKFKLKNAYYTNFNYGKGETSLSFKLQLSINSMLTYIFPEFSQTLIIVLEKQT